MVGDSLAIMEAWALLANVTAVHHTHSEVCHSDSNLIFSLFFATCSLIEEGTHKDSCRNECIQAMHSRYQAIYVFILIVVVLLLFIATDSMYLHIRFLFINSNGNYIP